MWPSKRRLVSKNLSPAPTLRGKLVAFRPNKTTSEAHQAV
jgi:hypothetical protein